MAFLPPGNAPSEPIQRASHSARGLKDVRVDHSSLEAAMPQQQLDRPDVGAIGVVETKCGRAGQRGINGLAVALPELVVFAE